MTTGLQSSGQIVINTSMTLGTAQAGANILVAGSAILISFAGSLIAGTLALPLYGTMFGPFALAVIFVSSPLLAGLWAFNLFGVHVLMCQWRIERDSIFGSPERIQVRPGRQASTPRP